MMRYAEILLNYAEAKEELQNGSLTASDWTNTVGALRARGGITGGTTVLPTTLDPYMQANYYPDCYRSRDHGDPSRKRYRAVPGRIQVRRSGALECRET
jgi:hypothetical protein